MVNCITWTETTNYFVKFLGSLPFYGEYSHDQSKMTQSDFENGRNRQVLMIEQDLKLTQRPTLFISMTISMSMTESNIFII